MIRQIVTGALNSCLNPLPSLVCVVGGGSASKDHNKKGAAETKDSANLEILAFSPERR